MQEITTRILTDSAEGELENARRKVETRTLQIVMKCEQTKNISTVTVQVLQLRKVHE